MARNKFKQRNSSTKNQSNTKMKRPTKDCDERFGDGQRTKSSNDPKWYASDPSLLRDAASFPFSNATGTPFTLNNPLLRDTSLKDLRCVPGIAVQYLVPSVGLTNDPTDPVNVAATSMYSFVRHANSGHANYDSPDLMLYVLAMTQVYSYINFLQRAYAVSSLYAQRNRYTPKALVTAMGVDYDSVISNLADFRYRLNAFINKASAMAVPSNMSIFNRHAFLYQDVYIDGESIKSQMYLYSPHAFWKFAWNSDNQSGELVDHLYNDGRLKTIDDLFNFGDEMLNVIIRSEDMNIMSGDILKAYGPNGIVKLAAVPEYLSLIPKFDAAVLEQFKNATVFPHFSLGSIRVYHSDTKGYLQHIPACYAKAQMGTALAFRQWVEFNALAESRVMTTEIVDPTPEVVMENSRLMSYLSDVRRDLETGECVGFINGGTEISVECKLFEYETDKSGNLYNLVAYTLQYGETVYVTDAEGILHSARGDAARLCFKYAPAVHRFVVRDGSTSGTFNAADGDLLYDIDNYTVLHTSDILRLHNAALLNQLNVPSIARLK